MMFLLAAAAITGTAFVKPSDGRLLAPTAKFSAPDQREFEKANSFELSLREAVKSGQKSRVSSYFQQPNGAAYLLTMAGRTGGLSKLNVTVLPTPPGWKNRGEFWVIFSTFQDIEQDHDPVYQLVTSGNSFKIGREVLEDDLAGWKIYHADLLSTIEPKSHSITVQAKIDLTKGSVERAPLFRLNDVYKLHSEPHPIVNLDKENVREPSTGSYVRAGSLLIPWTLNPKLNYTFKYSGILQNTQQDIVNDHEAYATAWWVPSLGRLPFSVESTITGPQKWKIRAEGNLIRKTEHGTLQTVTYNCPLAISFPKIIAGAYHLVASKVVHNEPFKIWQLDPINDEVANRDLANMIKAAEFYEKTLGPLPFHGYSCFDSDEYYGIESYSHTLLNKSITHFISHEMGHSYFGGIVPCAYVHDSWNEGVTEFIDSVVLLGDKDHSLENAFNSIDVNVPLTDMPVAWSYDNASYFRGCYVMKMLEEAIGDQNVLGGLKDLVGERQGIATRWDDLRPYFEKRAGRSLQWFWEQWIDNAVFPTLQIIDETTTKDSDGYTTKVVVEQSGTVSPFLLKFEIDADTIGNVTKKVVDMTAPQQEYIFHTEHKPVSIKINRFPYALVHVKPFVAPSNLGN